MIFATPTYNKEVILIEIVEVINHKFYDVMSNTVEDKVLFIGVDKNSPDKQEEINRLLKIDPRSMKKLYMANFIIELKNNEWITYKNRVFDNGNKVLLVAL